MKDKSKGLLHLDWGFIDETFNPQIITEYLGNSLKKNGYSILQYNEGNGIERLRILVSDFLKDFFEIKNISEENICITNGATAGLDLIGRNILNNEFDSVYFEPVYDTAIESLRINSRQVHGIKLNPFSGELITQKLWDELEYILSQEKTRLFYIVPNFNNPLGVTFSTKDRMKILDLCMKYSVTIIEDDPYKLYNFESSTLPENFINLDTKKQNVIYINSISKLLYPGIRIGYIIGNKTFISEISNIQKYTTSSPNLLMQGLAIEAFENGLIQKSFRHYFLKIKAKREKILEAIQKTNICSIIELTTPQGGFYLWGRFKDKNKNTKDLLELAKKNLVSYVPGHIYFTQKAILNSFRLGYSQIKLHDIEIAIERLKKTFF